MVQASLLPFPIHSSLRRQGLERTQSLSTTTTNLPTSSPPALYGCGAGKALPPVALGPGGRRDIMGIGPRLCMSHCGVYLLVGEPMGWSGQSGSALRDWSLCCQVECGTGSLLNPLPPSASGQDIGCTAAPHIHTGKQVQRASSSCICLG